MSERHFTQERAQLARMRPGKKWLDLVIAMSDQDVHEMYVKLNQQREKDVRKERNKA